MLPGLYNLGDRVSLRSKVKISFHSRDVEQKTCIYCYDPLRRLDLEVIDLLSFVLVDIEAAFSSSTGFMRAKLKNCSVMKVLIHV